MTEKQEYKSNKETIKKIKQTLSLSCKKQNLKISII